MHELTKDEFLQDINARGNNTIENFLSIINQEEDEEETRKEDDLNEDNYDPDDDRFEINPSRLLPETEGPEIEPE